MTQSGVSAFARLARRFAASAVLLLAGAGALAAQTGKIEGRVRDQAGAPIANAQVVIVGTAFSALTNPQGYYFINNVPSGTVSMRASFIGYKRTEVTGVRVLAGQTMTQDIQLESSPVQIEELTVVAAENPLVPRDEVTTKQRVDGAFTEALPVDRVSQVVLLQPGVVANQSGSAISIRGGRTDEANTYIDGVPVQPGGRGNQPTAGTGGNEISVGTNQFEEVSVTTGAASADQGNAQSGIINLNTITGGPRFAGRLAYETDEPFGSNTSIGFNRIEGNLSGPVFKGLTFALGAAIEGQESALVGKGRENFPIFQRTQDDNSNPVEDGRVQVPSFSASGDTTFSDYPIYQYTGTDGIALENNQNTSAYQFSGNLNFSYGNGSRLRLTGLASQNQGWAGIGTGFGAITGIWGNLPGLVRGFNNQNQVFTLGWTQNLTKSTERAFALDVALSYQRDRAKLSPWDENGGIGDGFLGLNWHVAPVGLAYDFDFLDETFSGKGQNGDQTWSRLDCYVFNDPSCSAPIDQTDPAVRDPFFNSSDYTRVNPYGLRLPDEFPTGGGGDTRLSLYKEDRYIGRAILDWQFDRYNRIKVGGEFVQYDITSYSHQFTTQIFSDYYEAEPQRAAAFIEDRLDIGDVVLQVGLRYDWYDSRASRWDAFPRVATNPNLEPGQDPRDLYVRDQAHDYLSPRVQVSFPVTERTNFRLSYAHAVQTPDFGLILGGIYTDLSTTNTNQTFGQDLDFGRSITFEFGIRHAFSDDMVLDVAAYNRDNLSNAAGRLVNPVDPRTNESVNLRYMTNLDFGNTRGIDVRLDRRFGQLFNGTLAYSFQQAQNTGSDPFSYLAYGSRIVNSIAGGNTPPPQSINPIALSRPHQLSGAFALTFPRGWNSGTALGSILQNFSAFMTFRFASGTAFTVCQDLPDNIAVTTDAVCQRGDFVNGLNSARLPGFKQLDLRLVKGFGLGRSSLFNVYLDFRNLLNFTNEVRQFTLTRDVNSAQDRERQGEPQLTQFANEAGQNDACIANGDFCDVDLTDFTSTSSNAFENCTFWKSTDGSAASPNCAYLIRAEQRFGNGDGIYTVDEQNRAIDSWYLGATNRGTQAFYGFPRQIRLGVEFNF